MGAIDADRPPAISTAAALELIAGHLARAVDDLGPYDSAMALVAAGLDLIGTTRGRAEYHQDLLEVRAAIDRMLLATRN
jgi:hypothetical protein